VLEVAASQLGLVVPGKLTDCERTGRSA